MSMTQIITQAVEENIGSAKPYYDYSRTKYYGTVAGMRVSATSNDYVSDRELAQCFDEAVERELDEYRDMAHQADDYTIVLEDIKTELNTFFPYSNVKKEMLNHLPNVLHTIYQRNDYRWIQLRNYFLHDINRNTVYFSYYDFVGKLALVFPANEIVKLCLSKGN